MVWCVMSHFGCLASNAGTGPLANIFIDTRSEVALGDKVLSRLYARISKNDRAWRGSDTSHHREHSMDG